MKNKLYFKDMESEQKEKLLDIKDFYNVVYEKVFNDFMEYQEEEFKSLNISKYVDIHDHYNSFFLTLKNDVVEFIENIDSDYINIENIKTYNDCKRILEKYYKTYANEEKQDKYYYLLERRAKKLLERIENQLHLYENPQQDDLVSFLIDEWAENFYSDFYILNDNFSVLYKDIHFTEVYN